MCPAVRVARSGDTSYLRASKHFSVTRGILEKYMKDTSRSLEELENVHLRRRTVLHSEPESKRLEYGIVMDQRYYGLRRQDIKCLAFQLAIRNCLKHPLTKKNQQLGRNGLDPF